MLRRRGALSLALSVIGAITLVLGLAAIKPLQLSLLGGAMCVAALGLSVPTLRDPPRETSRRGQAKVAIFIALLTMVPVIAMWIDLLWFRSNQ